MNGRSKVLEASNLLNNYPDTIDIFYNHGKFFDLAIQLQSKEYLELLLVFLENNVLKEDAPNKDVTRGFKLLSDLWHYLQEIIIRLDITDSIYLTHNSKRVFCEYIGVIGAIDNIFIDHNSDDVSLLGDPDLLLEQDIFCKQFFNYEYIDKDE
jgi:hypothetical protein